MKKLALLIIGLMFLNCAFSQEQEIKFKNPVVYKVREKKDSLFLVPSEINLEIVEWVFDSCAYNNNQFTFEFEIKNTTKEPIMCNKSMLSYNDSGLHSYAGVSSTNNYIVIQPGETGKVLFQSYPYNRKKRSLNTQFGILQGDCLMLVPFTLKFECISHSCGSTQ